MIVHRASQVPLAHLDFYFADCVKTAPHIVSVGCGSAEYEAWLTRDRPDARRSLILVDPRPTSFEARSPVLPIDYSCVTDLVEKRPEVVGNCLLLLLWPTPNESTFDFDALMELKPKSILVLYERPDCWTDGAAAGEKMHHLLLNPGDFDYKIICTTRYAFERRYFGERGKAELWPRIAWLAKRGSAVPVKKTCQAVQDLADRMSVKE